MIYNSFLLNGTWDMFYQKEKYESEAPPVLETYFYEPDPFVTDAVPGYWEDMKEKFRLTPFYGKLSINPEYGIQEYPLLGTPPDMALPNIVGNFFYKRIINCDVVEKNAVIYFEGVQNAASVWINDVFLGRHEGYSTPFEMKIPDGVLKKGENQIVISVSNHRLKGYKDRPVSGLTSRAANECTGGITGNVEIRFYKTPLRDISLFVKEDCKSVCVKIDAEGSVNFDYEVSDDNAVYKKGTAIGDFSFDATDLEMWSPENPKLYTLKIMCNGECCYRKFGVRRLVADGQGFKLNGKPYYLRGICEHCYFPETIHPNHDYVYYRSIIKNIKKLGFNFIRFHTYIPEEEYMKAADELGVVLHVESPNNTTVDEWRKIVKFCSKHPSVVIYCCGNELRIDEDYINHLEKCAETVHKHTDAFFSPLSAMPMVEYGWWDESKPLDPGVVTEPFKHHPEKLEKLSRFCDMYSSYANGHFSYFSLDGEHRTVDEWGRVYKKPRVSHEICIDGTYTDLSLKERYKGLSVGKTEMFSSIERHLEEKGVLKKAPLYFKNSSQWQRRIRKHCFEEARLCNNLAGFDFLGPIDTHWHTFGYDVGMMNEFYELKPGETVRNVLMYNSPTVILNDLNMKYNYYSEDEISFGIYVSHFGEKGIEDGEVTVRFSDGSRCIINEKISGISAENGCVTKVFDYKAKMPMTDKPLALKLYMTVLGDGVFAENEWEIYVFPKAKEFPAASNIVITKTDDLDELLKLLEEGKDVLLLGAGPFASKPTSFRIALAGRVDGNLATVVCDHPLLCDMPHEGFCGWQFAELLNGGSAVCFEAEDVPFNPIVEVVSTHKYVFRQAAVFEFKALKGKLLVASFDFKENDSAACWLLSQLVAYIKSDKFNPCDEVSAAQLRALAEWKVRKSEENKNFANNTNDKTML